MFLPRWLLLFLLSLFFAACSPQAGGTVPSTSAGTPTGAVVNVRVGYFPNITHSQALVGFANGAFSKALGDSAKLETVIFNAGPTAIEAMFAGALDISYIGPNPAINGYVKSKGDALRIVAGATSGGAVLVVRPESNIKSAADLAGKRLATPELGNTQDVAARFYLLSNKLQTTDKGGQVQVLPTKNPDILTLFLKKDIDAAWVPEPWGARLVREAGGQILLDERDLWPNGKFVTANIIVSRKFLAAQPELVKRFLAAHVELTEWINAHPDEAKKTANSEIERLTGKALPSAVLDEAWGRLEITYDPLTSSLFASADRAFELGYLGKQKPDLRSIYDLKLLNEVLHERGINPVG